MSVCLQDGAGRLAEKSDWKIHDTKQRKKRKSRNEKHSTTGTQSKTCYGKWHRERTTSCFRHTPERANGPTGKLTLHDNNMRNFKIRTSGLRVAREKTARQPNKCRRYSAVWRSAPDAIWYFRCARPPMTPDTWRETITFRSFKQYCMASPRALAAHSQTMDESSTGMSPPPSSSTPTNEMDFHSNIFPFLLIPFVQVTDAIKEVRDKREWNKTDHFGILYMLR